MRDKPLAKLIVNSFAFACATMSFHQSTLAMDKTDDIDTNRPEFHGFTARTAKVERSARKRNALSRVSQGKWQYDVPETEVRVGLTKGTEFQAFVPNYNLLHSQVATNEVDPTSISTNSVRNRTTSQVSDITEIGLKHQIGPLFANSKKLPGYLRNYNLAAIVGVTPPTGSTQISGSGTAGIVRFPWSKGIGKNWSIAGMQSLLLLNSGHDLSWQPDVLVGRNVGAKASIFMEYGGFFTQSEAPLNIMHFGGVYKATKRQQIDMQFGFGMNGAAPIAFIGVGYSFRFDKLAW